MHQLQLAHLKEKVEQQWDKMHERAHLGRYEKKFPCIESTPAKAIFKGIPEFPAFSLVEIIVLLKCNIIDY